MPRFEPAEDEALLIPESIVSRLDPRSQKFLIKTLRSARRIIDISIDDFVNACSKTRTDALMVGLPLFDILWSDLLGPRDLIWGSDRPDSGNLTRLRTRQTLFEGAATVEWEAWNVWSEVDLERMHGRTLIYTVGPEITHPFGRSRRVQELQPQRLLFKKDFSLEEQKLIESMKKRSRNPRYTGIRRQDDKQAGTPVEVAAWRFELTSGEVITFPFTSRKHSQISNKSISRSIDAANRLLLSRSVTMEKIVSIQYFHTHPNGGPLSYPDELMALAFHNQFHRVGFKGQFNAYAIAAAESHDRIFQIGF